MATTCLLAVLCMLYPAAHTLFLGLIMLDIFSHWFQMYSTLATGSATHKARARRRGLWAGLGVGRAAGARIGQGSGWWRRAARRRVAGYASERLRRRHAHSAE